MKARMIVPALLGAVLLSSPVLAADAATACKTLDEQFKKVDPFHMGAEPHDSRARALHAEVAKLCAENKASEGAAKIREALAVWGVTPHA